MLYEEASMRTPPSSMAPLERKIDWMEKREGFDFSFSLTNMTFHNFQRNINFTSNAFLIIGIDASICYALPRICIEAEGTFHSIYLAPISPAWHWPPATILPGHYTLAPDRIDYMSLDSWYWIYVCYWLTDFNFISYGHKLLIRSLSFSLSQKYHARW